MSEPLNLDEFEVLAELVKGYELIPGRDYLIVCGKSFDHALANKLFEKLREVHPEINIHVVGTAHPKQIELKVKKEPIADDPSDSSSSL